MPIISNRPPLDEQAARARAAGANVIELRVDLIGNITAVERFLNGPRMTPCILTVRSAAEGGAWDGPDDERIALIERLGLLMPGYVDVELVTFQRSANLRQKLGLIAELNGGASAAHAIGARSKAENALAEPTTRRARNRLILSVHDVHATPSDIAGVMNRFPGSPALIHKGSFVARDGCDALRILIELERRARQQPTILIGMGEAGVATRILARKFGAFLSFAAFDNESESAPGQLAPATMRGLYRWDSIDGHTAVYGIVGWPVGHSKSPLVHNAGMAANGVNGVYLPWPVAPDYEAFARFMDTLADSPQLGLRGLSVTIPHKENAFRWLSERGANMSEPARRCGAVNTLSLSDGQWRGDNTDAQALAEMIALASWAGPGEKPRTILVLGSGGIARAAIATAQPLAERLVIANRTESRAAALAAEFACESVAWSARTDVSPDVVIQCTSLGMHPRSDESPLPPDALLPNSTVIETVYAPPRTRLLQDAAARGCRTVSGVDLFIAQAERQFELWQGQSPPQGLFAQLLNGQAPAPR
ncbi:MAG: type I 3-dehydroquinate dehydratase [Phycisphaerales bacterium]|nr:type I 3-dehydroquinate dehydratase [Phycisphaerales bacterium]